MIDTVYIDANESNASVAARNPDIVEHVPGGLRYLGDAQTVVFANLNDSVATKDAALRRFARGG